MTVLQYRIGQASEQEIAGHLRLCDANFNPPLSARVNLQQYAAKLAEHAVRFEAWADCGLAGLLAAYCNDKVSGLAFITNVSVLGHCQQQGIAKELVRQCVDYAKTAAMRGIRLEVEKTNVQAINLYLKHGFRAEDSEGQYMKMVLRW